MQDVRKTRDGEGYADRTELLDYCRRSANPVGRLLLHLYRVDDPLSISRSDAICTALQLINFWQDAGVDLARGRRYLPDADCAAHGLSPAQLQAGASATNGSRLRHQARFIAPYRAAPPPFIPQHRKPPRAITGW